MKHYLWCPKCKKYPDTIVEKYQSEPELVEVRKWNSETGNYELVETNLDQIEFEQLCGECTAENCETKLEYKMRGVNKKRER